MAGRPEPSQHSLRLEEEEALQIALALSLEDAQADGRRASAATEDERLARELQDAEYAQAAAQQAPAPAPVPASTGSFSQRPSGYDGSVGPAPAGAVPPRTGLAGSYAPAGSNTVSSSSGRIAEGLRTASLGAAQRIGSGTQQLWHGFKRLVDPDSAVPPPRQQPVYGAPPYGMPPPHYPPPQHQPPCAPTVTQPPPGSQPQQQQWQQQQPQQHLTEDEALAQALQRQFDLEDAGLRQQPQQQPQPQFQRPAATTGPLGANLAPVAAAAAAGGSRPRPAAAVPPPPAETAAVRSQCAGCGGPLYSLMGRSPYIKAVGRRWHPGCLVCAACSKPIGERGGVAFVEREQRLYHPQCHKATFHPKCGVCGDYVPEQANRRIVWNEVPFWKQKYCPQHHDATPRCTGCDRLRPHGEAWAELEDGRHICLACLNTVVTDTRDAQPLWQNVLSFFDGMGMRLPHVPPMMLVDGGALNEAEGQETQGKGRGGGPVFHVRGLTLTEEHRSIRTILRIPGGNPFAVQQEAVQVGPTLHTVTGILVLYGLPRLLCGSVLAHECMHAWLRMSGFSSHCHLDQQVEEGLCQLMALLWLDAQAPQDEYEERLAAFFAHQIRSDESIVYGDGFRRAHEAFQEHGLQKVLEHVRRAGTFPPCSGAI